jgi:membrane protein YqaA with SNARE-associated domain
MGKYLKHLSAWILNLAGSKWSGWVLAISSFTDASFLPLPTSTLFLLLVGQNPKKVKDYFFLATLGAITGALLAYFAGHFASYSPEGGYSGLVQFLFHHVPGFSVDSYNSILILYNRWGSLLLFVVSFTPIPYGIFALFSGVFGINIFAFLITTLVSQAVKFIILAVISQKLSHILARLSTLKLNPVQIVVTSFNLFVIFISNSFRNLLQ